MDKPPEKTKEEVKTETPVFEKRPELAEASPQPNMEVMSHNWQPGSPAVDMRDASGNLAGAVNTVAKLNVEKKAKAISLTPEEYTRRTLLDVSDPKFINPSLDHHKVE